MSVRTVTVFDVRLRSPRALRDAMTYRRYSIRSLAEAVTRDLVRQKARGASRSLIGHLLTGEQKTARPEVARSIEEILDVPAGSLFETRVSNLSREVRNERGTVAPGIAALLALLASAVMVAMVVGFASLLNGSLAELTEQSSQWIGGAL